MNFCARGWGQKVSVVDKKTEVSCKPINNVYNTAADCGLAALRVEKGVDYDLYRTAKLPETVLQAIKKTNAFQDLAFLSTSKEIIKIWPYNTLFKLKPKSGYMYQGGTDISSISLHEAEVEVLFQRATKWKVTKFENEVVECTVEKPCEIFLEEDW